MNKSIILCGFLLLLLFPPSSSSHLVPAQSNERSLTYAYPYDFSQYSAWTQDSYLPAPWVSAVYAGLYKRQSGNLTWVPDLAAAMPQIDGNEFTVSLREGVLFSNGHSITADDVIFSFKVAVTPLINVATYKTISRYFDNSSFIKLDTSTIKFVYNNIDAFAIRALSVPIIERVVFEARYDSCLAGTIKDCSWNNPDGSDALAAGPFMIDSIDTANEVVTVIKNQNYWDAEHVLADKIIFKMIPFIDDPVATLNDEIDIMDFAYFPPKDAFADHPEIHSEIVGSLSHQEMALNHLSPYWGNGSAVPDGDHSDDLIDALLIRRAMSHTLNREFICTTILEQMCQPAASTMPPVAIGFNQDLHPDEYNITKAKELMEQAGFDYSTLNDTDGDGVYDSFFFELTILSPTYTARSSWGPLLALELPKIGIGVKEYVETGWNVILPRTFDRDDPPPLYDEGGYDLFLVGYGWGIDWDPRGLYEKTSFIPNGENFYNYVNQTLENLIADYTSELDPLARIEKAYAVQKAIHDDLPVIPGIYPLIQEAWKANVTGIDPILIQIRRQDWAYVGKNEWIPTITTSSESSLPSEETTFPTTSPTSQSPLPWFSLPMIATMFILSRKRK